MASLQSQPLIYIFWKILNGEHIKPDIWQLSGTCTELGVRTGVVSRPSGETHCLGTTVTMVLMELGSGWLPPNDPLRIPPLWVHILVWLLHTLTLGWPCDNRVQQEGPPVSLRPYETLRLLLSFPCCPKYGSPSQPPCGWQAQRVPSFRLHHWGPIHVSETISADCERREPSWHLVQQRQTASLTELPELRSQPLLQNYEPMNGCCFLSH